MARKEPASAPDQALDKRAQELDRTDVADHVHNVVTAGLNAVPFVGGSLASLIDDYIPKRKEERLREFLRDLAEDVQQIQDRLDESSKDHVRTDEFAYLIEKSFRGAMESYQKEKIEAYRAILVNSLLPNAPDEDRKLFFVSLVDALTPLHFRIMRILRDPEGYDAATGNRVGAGGGLSTSRKEILQKLMPEYEADLLEATWRDLNVRGVVTTDSLGGMITDRGISQMARLLTPVGKQFVGFVTLPSQ